MSWTERDGPAAFAPKRRGFGTIVMATMAERSVDGGVDLDCAPPGLSWCLTCPAANALAPALLPFRRKRGRAGQGALRQREKSDARRDSPLATENELLALTRGLCGARFNAELRGRWLRFDDLEAT